MKRPRQRCRSKRRRCLQTPGRLLRIASAHNVVSARPIEQAGLDRIWASSPEIAKSSSRVDDVGSIIADNGPTQELPLVGPNSNQLGGEENLFRTNQVRMFDPWEPAQAGRKLRREFPLAHGESPTVDHPSWVIGAQDKSR